jgi:hypothetical protein
MRNWLGVSLLTRVMYQSRDWANAGENHRQQVTLVTPDYETNLHLGEVGAARFAVVLCVIAALIAYGLMM